MSQSRALTSEECSARCRDEVATLVRAAAAGDARAWDAIVHRFGGVLRAVTRGFRLSEADANDVVQTTWLRMLGHIHRLEDPSALQAWLVTTARRESLRSLQSQRRQVPTDQPLLEEVPDPATLDDQLADEERGRALRRAVDELPVRHRELVELLLTRPDCSYQQVGAQLGMPVGSIGPTRERCLARLRRDPGLLSAVA